jgi:hypothetical protein
MMSATAIFHMVGDLCVNLLMQPISELPTVDIDYDGMGVIDSPHVPWCEETELGLPCVSETRSKWTEEQIDEVSGC